MIPDTRQAVIAEIASARMLLKMFNGAKSRANKRGLACTISYQDVVALWESLSRDSDGRPLCPVLGTPLVCVAGDRGKWSASKPSLDRIRNHLGYVRGNVAIISLRANGVKNDAEPSELRAIVTWLDGFGCQL